MKNINEIKEMLNAFYEGITTQEEENQLKEFFSQNNLPEEMQIEKEIFFSLFERDEIPTPDGMENRLSSMIDDLEERDQKPKKVENTTKRRLWLEIGGIAASVCLLISIGLSILNQRDNNDPKPATSLSQLSLEDQKKVQEANKALEMVSKNFNKGMQSVQENL